MNVPSPAPDHRRFLKGGSDLRSMIGDFVPESLSLLPSSPGANWRGRLKAERGTIVFAMSAGCSVCDYGPIEEFVGKYPHFFYIMLYEGSAEQLEAVRREYGFEFDIERCDIQTIRVPLGIVAVPWAIVLNAVGQVIGSGLFNNTFQLEWVAKPLLRAYPERPQ